MSLVLRLWYAQEPELLLVLGLSRPLPAKQKPMPLLPEELLPRQKPGQQLPEGLLPKLELPRFPLEPAKLPLLEPSELAKLLQEQLPFPKLPPELLPKPARKPAWPPRKSSGGMPKSELPERLDVSLIAMPDVLVIRLLLPVPLHELPPKPAFASKPMCAVPTPPNLPQPGPGPEPEPSRMADAPPKLPPKPGLHSELPAN